MKPENQVEIYQSLSILAKETDPSVFQKQMSNFIQLWLPTESDFVKYFMRHYQNRAGINAMASCVHVIHLHFVITEKWAKCYLILITETQTQICILKGAVITNNLMCTLIILIIL